MTPPAVCRWPASGGGSSDRLSHNAPMMEWYSQYHAQTNFVCGNVETLIHGPNAVTCDRISIPVPEDVCFVNPDGNPPQTLFCWHWFTRDENPGGGQWVTWRIAGKYCACEENFAGEDCPVVTIRNIYPEPDRLYCNCVLSWPETVDAVNDNYNTPGSVVFNLCRLGNQDTFDGYCFVVDAYLQMRKAP